MIFNPDRKTSYTLVAKHFASARAISKRKVVAPIGKRKPTPIPMLRLSFGALTPKEDRSILELFKLMTRVPLKSTFIFPDASFFQKAMGDRNEYVAGSEGKDGRKEHRTFFGSGYV